MKTLKKYVIRTLIVLFVLAAAVGSFFTFVPFSEGMRAGQVIKLSKKGVIFKTHEGELNLMMMPSTNNLGTMTPNVWAFSVQNKEVADQILKASATGERLELYYKEKYFKFPWQGDTKYYVYRVESAPAVAPQFPTNIPIGGVNGGKPIEVK
ncbi:MAG: hypothetical protein KA109_16105 [Saprospiraceae bacterium]|jgi:hypothetical protein|nr:hypothetical protein [Saprospiraceae bacterium]MBK9642886.1 hypothetical protein [Candidatus Vicinibacter affinis]MBK6480935.1 hypothetical protein [Saprospiraceae bacterium]MBK7373313.1 hypothetical protein [Saprospiraceae bacterium]MBK7436975.1 hypothetical protein [Saprospiraceae bacterium]